MQRDDALQLVGELRAMLRLALVKAFFSGRCVCGMWSTPASSVPNILRLVTMPPTEMPPKLTP